MSATTDEYQDYWINPRIKIAALWTAMLFIFAYVTCSACSERATYVPTSKPARFSPSPSDKASCWA